MSGLFGTLGTANKGLNAQQKALETASHNISNSNNANYSRQRVNMQADLPYTLTGVGQIGTGVKIAGITRIVDDFVIGNIRNETANFNYYSQKSEVLGQLESIFNTTPGSKGLTDNLATYFDSWTKLGNNPEFDNSKSIVLENANNLTDTIHHTAQQITDLSRNTLATLEKSVLDVNSKLQELDELNNQIYKISSDGSMPNDLLDKRDALLKDISSFGKVDASFDKYGRVYLKMAGQDILTKESVKVISVVTGKSANGQSLVSVGGNSLATKAEVTDDYPVGQLVISESSTQSTDFKPLTIGMGAAKGMQDALADIDVRMSELNNFAFSFATAVNLIHSDGGKGSDFFTLGQDGNYAQNINVTSDIKADPSKISTGKDLNGTDIGDGSRALAISKLKDATFDFPVSQAELEANYDASTMSFKKTDGGLTFLGAYVDIVTKNGIAKQQADNRMESQAYILHQLEQKNASISGVNINEEVSDVIRFQRAFQANSKVISVISEMLDTLINRTGV
ncbi:flagellar hook-associated protein FlgK [Vagococcus penaei]|uniref:Flagellar hook-associated protein 1 n=1 Tax=Vagococcus penaei TaxID=633807 RepID=A0A1Q2D8E5_9ENTE|nr:flagellar hook-associated protein FlgK [Vagococcus penaei]AQP54591.1 flagellar hook-associated protein FlgK [Vagococcus penaei]RSU06697.1 flagellar hook-associated protein FlgK [Vagococcus penaei]